MAPRRRISLALFVIVNVLLLVSCFENTDQDLSKKPGNSVTAATKPNNTYFSLAVSDGSNNHVGNKLLYLEFQDDPDLSSTRQDIVISPRVDSGDITIDGSASEWNEKNFTKFQGLVLNNYPLSFSLDAVPVEISVASHWDKDNVYFLVRWEDANHIRNDRYQSWVYLDDPITGLGWQHSKSAGVQNLSPPAKNISVINKDHRLVGAQLDDQLVMAFPIADAGKNFQADGLGCSAFCHIDWSAETANDNYTGEQSATMYTTHVNDKLDIWHWSAGRSQHSDMVDDGYLYNKASKSSGFGLDAGNAPFNLNNLANNNPQFIPIGGINSDPVLQGNNVETNNTAATVNEQIPFVITAKPSLSRADIESKAVYDVNTYTWTVEFKRKRKTGNSDDFQFDNKQTTERPSGALLIQGNATNGETLYNTHCKSCHSDAGIGTSSNNVWTYPRIQRSSGAFILKALESVSAMQPAKAALGSNRSQWAQASEDIASYLQKQQTFVATKYKVTIAPTSLIGYNNIISSDPAGINCPPTCAANFDEFTQIKLAFDQTQQLNLLAWGNKCATPDASCQFYLLKDESFPISTEVKPIMYDLIVVKGGLGKIESSPSGISCGLYCSAQFTEGTEITLTPTPDTGYQLEKWVGTPCDGSTGVCTFTIQSNVGVSANFIVQTTTP